MQCSAEDHILIEVLGRTGFDYVWLEFEGGATSHFELEDAIRTAEGVGLVSLVQIPGPDDSTAARQALAAGAQGLILPMVRSAADVRAILDVSQRAAIEDQTFLLIPMIETAEALANIEEICTVEQVKILCFAPDNSKIKEAWKQVNQAAARHNIALMSGPVYEPSQQSYAEAIGDGITVFCLGIDVTAFR